MAQRLIVILSSSNKVVSSKSSVEIDILFPMRPRSFRSAPTIATSGQVRFFEHAQRIRFRFVRLDSEHAQSDGKSVNFRLSVLDLTRGHAHQKEGQTARFQRTQRTELLTSSARSTLVLQRNLKFKTVISKSILVPRAYDPSGLWQGSIALALSNDRSPRFMDFPSNLANLIN